MKTQRKGSASFTLSGARARRPTPARTSRAAPTRSSSSPKRLLDAAALTDLARGHHGQRRNRPRRHASQRGPRPRRGRDRRAFPDARGRRGGSGRARSSAARRTRASTLEVERRRLLSAARARARTSRRRTGRRASVAELWVFRPSRRSRRAAPPKRRSRRRWGFRLSTASAPTATAPTPVTSTSCSPSLPDRAALAAGFCSLATAHLRRRPRAGCPFSCPVGRLTSRPVRATIGPNVSTIDGGQTMRFVSRVFAASALLCAATTATTLAAVIYVNAAATGVQQRIELGQRLHEPPDRAGRGQRERRALGGGGTYKPHALRPDRQLRSEERRRRLRRIQRHGDASVAAQPDVNVTILSGDIGTAGVVQSTTATTS